MGLDMYMYAKQTMPREKAVVMMKCNPEMYPKWDNEWAEKSQPPKNVTLTAEAAYWRKANSVHKWFVDQVQGGVDDCGHYPVTQKQLKQLRDSCRAVLNGEASEDHGLVPTEGFFFGSTDPVHQKVDLENTIEQIDRALKDFKGWDFEYHSSW